MHSKKMLHTFIFFLFPMPIFSANLVYLASFGDFLFSIPGLMLFILFCCYISSILSDKENYFTVKRTKLSLKNEYSRDTPYDGNFEDIFFILLIANLSSIKDLLIAYFLKWNKEKIIIVTSKNREVQFIIKEPTYEMSAPEKELFRLILSAAGKNRILTLRKFNRWEESNVKEFPYFVNALLGYSRKKMLEQGYLDDSDKSCFIFLKKPSIVFTEKGTELMSDSIKFKNYFKNFTVLNTGVIHDIDIWDEDMIYAGLFGLSEDLEKSFKNLFPTYDTISVFSTDSVNSISKTLKRFEGIPRYFAFRNLSEYKYRRLF